MALDFTAGRAMDFSGQRQGKHAKNDHSKISSNLEKRFAD